MSEPYVVMNYYNSETGQKIRIEVTEKGKSCSIKTYFQPSADENTKDDRYNFGASFLGLVSGLLEKQEEMKGG